MASLMPLPKMRFVDNAGAALASGKVYTYEAGTSTPKATYTTAAGDVANANPVILDARGEAGIWLAGGAYKIVVKTSADVTLMTVDNVANSDPIIVNTIADLTALPSNAATAVEVLGYYAAGDGGGGLFYWSSASSATHNGGNILQPDSAPATGRWLWADTTNNDARRFGCKVDGTTDDTTRFQAAVTAMSALGRILELPEGTMVITDTISIPTGTQISGKHRNQGQPAFTNGSKISFTPSTAKSLFVPSGTPSLYRVGYLIEGIYILGNSAAAGGNSIYAIDTYGMNKARFRDLTISGFRTGVRNYGTINNRWEFCAIVNTYIEAVLYNGGIPTTDVWEQCYIANTPVGVQTSGDSVGIRWTKCLFESITTHGVNLVKEVYGWMFDHCYGEDTPSANVSTNAMFRVGFDGSTLQGATQLTIVGGYYGGRNAGAVGSFLDVDYTDGVILGCGVTVARFTNGVKTSANTTTNQVVLNGFIGVSISSTVTDPTKISGYYPIGTLSSGTRNRQAAYFGSLNVEGTVTINSAAAAGSGTELILGKSTGTTIGAAGGASALPATPLGYLSAYLGTTHIKIPYYSA